MSKEFDPAEFNWFCDNCNDDLYSQEGFSPYCEVWECTECGQVNYINEDEVIYPDDYDDDMDCDDDMDEEVDNCISGDYYEYMLEPDETGALVTMYFTCPYCDTSTHETLFYNNENLERLEEGCFETDITCPFCGAELIVQYE